MQIKNIIFDLAEVLLTGIKETGKELARKHALETGEPLQNFENSSPLLVPISKEFFLGNVSEDEYIAEVLAKYPELGDEDHLKSHIRENFREVEGMRDIVSDLKAQGYKLAILSLHSKEWIEYCEAKFNFHQFFDVLAYSYRDGVSKPEPQAFQLALEKLGATPEDTLFIDDSSFNTDAAEALGIKSIIFKDAETLKKQLAEILPAGLSL